MDENSVFEVLYNRAPKEGGLVCDSPAWSREAHALTRSYFENCHGVQWIAAAFPHANGRVLRVTSSDSEWDTFEGRFERGEAVDEVVRHLGVMMSPEELLWLSAVLVSMDALDVPSRRTIVRAHHRALQKRRSA